MDEPVEAQPEAEVTDEMIARRAYEIRRARMRGHPKRTGHAPSEFASRRRCERVGLALRDQPIELVCNDAVTLTGVALEASAVENRD